MIEIGTIGSLPCEIALCKILSSLNNRKLNSKVMKVYHYFNFALNTIDHDIKDAQVRSRVRHLLRKAVIEGIKNTEFPAAVSTHLQCVVQARFRKGPVVGKTQKDKR